MNLARWPTKAAAVASLSVVLAVGCSVNTTSEPTSQTSAATTRTQSLLGICGPLTCCFPDGGEWADNPFENGLRSLGCTKPHAYTESYGRSQWWLYSSCPLSVDLTTLVVQYATVSPYYSQLVVNECLELYGIVGGDPTDVFVEWDPTCSGCRYPQ
jgi:hypothetical protein